MLLALLKSALKTCLYLEIQMKNIIFALFILAATLLNAQDNVFLNRGYWAKNPTVETVKADVEKGNDPTVMNYNGFDATTFALITGSDTDVIKYLLSFDANSITKRTHDSRIYLHWATMGGNAENIKLLLNMGSEVDALDSKGNTPLVFAASSRMITPEIGKLFTDWGVKLVEEKNKNGANLLLLSSAFMKSEADLAYLTNEGMKITDTDDSGNTIFSYAVRRDNCEFLEYLISANIDYTASNNEGGNAFMFAAQGTRGFSHPLKTYQFIQRIGIDPKMVTTSGSTPLHIITSRKADVEIVEFFISNGANVDQKDQDGNTPFLNACKRNEAEVINLLLKNTKNPNDKNNKGQTALMLAAESNNSQIIELLARFISEETIQMKDHTGNGIGYYLVKSFDAGDTEYFRHKFEMLQKLNAKINELQAGNNTLYHLVAEAGKHQMLEYLKPFDIPIDAVNDEGMTALHIAAMKSKDTATLKAFLNMGADVKATTDFGETAYDLAVENEILSQQNVDLKFLK